jgi:hypothetical protein
MGTGVMFMAAILFILVLTFDISFNLRRLLKEQERIWRKLDEINNSLRK